MADEPRDEQSRSDASEADPSKADPSKVEPSKVELSKADESNADGPPADMLQGTLDLLILHALSLGPMHGWGLSKRIRELSRDVLQVNQGSLYPALHRLEYRGLVEAEWGRSHNNRRAKIYSMTPKGADRLGVELHEWQRFVQAMQWVLDASAPDVSMT